MSRWSGKADLADHIMMEKMYEKDNHYESDEMECFEIFKKKTGGKIYQSKRVKVDVFNRDYIASKCPQFKYEESTITVSDARSKSGESKRKVTKYYYFGKEMSLANINKTGVYIEEAIPFKTIFDIIPFYPHIIIAASISKDTEHVVISEKSHVDTMFEDFFTPNTTDIQTRYRQELQNHYAELFKTYYAKDFASRIRTEIIKPDETGICELQHIIDTNFEINYNINKPHWTGIEYIEGNKVKVHENDLKCYLVEDFSNNSVSITYVSKD